MLLLDLVEKLEPYGKLIQNNTDGIVIEVSDYERNFDKIDDIVYEWETRTGLKMDFDTYFGEIFQKDVNNYLLIDRENGHFKAKGSYVKGQSRLDYDLPIVNKALRAYMIDGVSPEQTINNCNDLIEFQLMAKLSNKYTHAQNAHGEKLNEKTLRIFASNDSRDTILYKVSKRTGKPQKIANCPEHSRVYNDSVNGVKAPAWLNKKWYIDMTYKRLEDFGINKI
jgi:hypothetical protein